MMVGIEVDAAEGWVQRNSRRSRESYDSISMVVASFATQRVALEALQDAMRAENVERASLSRGRAADEERIKLLRAILQELGKLDGRKAQLDLQKKAADDAVGAFNKKASDLRDLAKQEEAREEDNVKYAAAYEWMRASLVEYANSRPIELVGDLSDLALEFYNEVNEDDPADQMLAGVLLPTQKGERIGIRFAGDPDSEHDALHVLSEGHVRCLGLAILLAKAVHDGAPTIVFDDAVNAIDDEHRSGVAKVLTSHPKMVDIQVIVTSHGEQFVKTLENEFSPEERNKLVSRVDFEMPGNGGGVQVRDEGATKNYLVRAREHLDGGQTQQALTDVRRAVENLSARLWKRLGKNHRTDIRVSMRGPKSKPDLRSVVQGLRKRLMELEKVTNSKDREAIITEIERVELEWDHLNWGTHDDEPQPELDSAVANRLWAATDAWASVILAPGVKI